MWVCGSGLYWGTGSGWFRAVWCLSSQKMKLLLLFLAVLDGSQRAPAVQVEVYEGARSVLLPCRVSFVLEDTTVMWDRYDLSPTTVHQWYEGRDELDNQNQRFSGRTAMASVSKVEVKVEQGSQSVQLPCESPPPLPKGTRVEWTRSDPKPMIVHVFPNSSDRRQQQDEQFCSRTEMKADLLRSGDLGVTLRFPTERDSGEYVCSVYREGDVLRQKVELRLVKEKFPAWATVLMVLLGLGLVAGGGSALYLWQNFTKVPKVEVSAGADSVLLPFRTSSNLSPDFTVAWTRFGLRPMVVHLYQNQKDWPDKQNHVYANRTKMTEEPVQTGDLSLTLKQPQPHDSGFYTCTINNGRAQQKTHVRLQVRVPHVVAVEGDESVVLSCRTKVQPPHDALVEWTRSEPWPMIVHTHQIDSSLPDKLDWFYRNRTTVKLENKVLSLTLKDPTLFDAGTYICTVSRAGRVLMTRNILLNVKDPTLSQDDESNPADISSATPLIAMEAV
ncbi:uncharacterized protein LOC114866115 isoform X2 [Betta splendens]|uniref:Uncharacterized protein LOC114866115 isoform X2 n=1 Tax=Betta splendens TaxID=158456 RepID=A0A9W2Y401_BETSP|nr:uncharacterized protein LOC114866115 isoform X2 [Betta splendens]